MLINEKYVKLLLSTLYKVFACHYITNSANLSDINLFQVNESSPRQNMSNITVIRLQSIHMESIEVLQRRKMLPGSLWPWNWKLRKRQRLTSAEWGCLLHKKHKVGFMTANLQIKKCKRQISIALLTRDLDLQWRERGAPKGALFFYMVLIILICSLCIKFNRFCAFF